MCGCGLYVSFMWGVKPLSGIVGSRVGFLCGFTGLGGVVSGSFV
jgi:hypothetical protein